MSNKIAVLGWGSFIWDPQPDFDRQINTWIDGGPLLPIEFCRISKTRGDALTLVIDSDLGTKVETLYALSKQSNLHDVVADLRRREGTSVDKIGYINRITGDKRGRNTYAVEAIQSWAQTKNIQAVVWTDLSSNFPEIEPSQFLGAALSHLKKLEADGRLGEAVKYIINAPSQITTRLRTFLMNDNWFKNCAREYIAKER